MVVNEEDQMIIDNVEEYINDENKIVSYKWLTLNLSIHVNKAKSLLEYYYRGHTAHTHAVYFLAGSRTVENNRKRYEYRLVKDEALEETRKLFDDVPSCHIYSLQKCDLKDSSSLFAADIDIVKENLHKNGNINPIICSQLKISSKKTRSENGTHNGYSEAKPVSQKEKTDVKMNDQNTKVANQGNTLQKKNAKLDSKSAPPLSFFGKKASGKSSEIDTKAAHESEVVGKKKETYTSESKHKTSKSGIASAFAHAHVKPKKTQEKSNEVKEVTENKAPSRINSKSETQIRSDQDIDPSSKKEKSTNITKKRKVITNDSSDSDNDFEQFVKENKDPGTAIKRRSYSEGISKEESPIKENDVDIVAPTPELWHLHLHPTPEQVKPKSKRRRKEVAVKEEETTKKENSNKEEETSPRDTSEEKSSSSIIIDTSEESSIAANQPRKRGRRRVLKSKQYVDEDGFMVTHKEYESESCSDDDNMELPEEKVKGLPEERKKEVERKKASKEMEKKANAAMKKPKHQSSIKDFFKKK